MFVQLTENLFKPSDFIQCQKLILAVSGGSDSLALLFLVRDYLRKIPVAPKIVAVTIDHQLRRESAQEAEDVAAICFAHQIQHVTVRWEEKKPKTNISQKARIARYNLLYEEAEKQGAGVIMTGHTLNDQVETYYMRSKRLQKKSVSSFPHHDGQMNQDGQMSQKEGTKNSSERTAYDEKLKTLCREETLRGEETLYGEEEMLRGKEMLCERGLACIPREALLRGKVRLIRPLLCVERQTLRAYLNAQKLVWIDDPTNEDLKYERVRARHYLAHSQQKIVLFAKKIDDAALQRREQAQKIADLILALDITVNYGRCFIKRPEDSLYEQPEFSFIVGLFAVLMGGGSYLLPSQKLAMLGQKLCFPHPENLSHPEKGQPILEKRRFTLAGAVIEVTHRGIACWREARNMKEEVIAPGHNLLWDGRYWITNNGKEPVKVGPADIKSAKYCLNRGMQAGLIDLEHPHFPSLQSLIMLSHHKGVDIPELASSPYIWHEIIIKRAMAPFDWLLSHEDIPIVRAIEPFFRIEEKR
ncbi:tRNA lysidine(34) synthetase TilS [Bartonella ancashensis]|uniref:tRNA(Ile)-lysidine synthase n=1 Tax=Bartonella ancashensis TaxID=1318743 RepID=A0A0M3T2M6_9HYPH|nr:tRNA lysidine(34) synthetase TilS [Bartonella ancashensis]ALE03111.1 tRNA(Ile)-lysidine synthetase [Bartonella ancashensis]